MDELPRLHEVAQLAAALRGTAPPKALSLVRYVRALIGGQGNPLAVHTIASERYGGDPTLLAFTKAAVSAGTLSNSSQIAGYKQLQDEFIEASRPSSIVLQLTNARRIPPRVQAPRITSGAVTGWVGEGSPKTVAQLALDNVVLQAHKLGSIVAYTAELLRFSSPSADSIIRGDLIASVNYAVDSAFVSATAGSASRPAGILNSVTPVASTGSTPAAVGKDLVGVAAAMVTAGSQLKNPVLLMHPATSLAINLQIGAASPQFPKIIVSSAVLASTIILLDEAEILIADDGSIEVDVSEEASVMMDSSPVQGTTAYQSLWQLNMAAIRVERFISWAPARAAAASAGYISAFVA